MPVGSLEQHGPHLPVEIDSLLGETVALRTARLAAEKEPVLVLPMLWTGLSEHHMSFGGTIDGNVRVMAIYADPRLANANVHLDAVRPDGSRGLNVVQSLDRQ